MRGLFLFLIGWLLVAVPSVSAAAPARLDGETKALNLGPHLAYFKDDSRALTVTQVARPEYAEQFRPVGDTTPNLGYSRAAVWFRFTVESDAPTDADWLLDIAFPRLDRVEVFEPDPAAPDGFRVLVNGDTLPFSEREIKNRNIVFRIRVRPGAPRTFYARVTTTSTVQFPATLYSPEQFCEADHDEQAVLGMFYGIVLVMAVYNLFIFLATRDRGYFFYVFYGTSLGFTLLSLHGWGFEYLWPKNPWWNNAAIAFFPGLTVVFGNLFAKSFLGTPGRAPWSDRALTFLAGLGALSAMGAFTPFLPRLFPLIAGLFIVSAGANLLVGVLSLADNHRPAIFYLTAQSALLISGIAASFNIFGFLPSSLFTRHAVPVGMTLELVLLSLGLADRIRTLRRQKEAAEANAAIKEKDSEIFRLRNVELADANRANADSLAYAQSIQRAILPNPEEFAAAFAATVRLFRPKDVVSGDFYWLYRAEDAVYFAVADCTGHGVPGAFMSMIGNDLLNQLVIERGMTSPAGILVKLHEGVRRALRQEVTPDSFDGMDIALCRIAGRTVTFAGARRPLYVTAPGRDLIEIKGDRRGIAGTRRNESPVFIEHGIEIPENATLWLTTDGFADQCNAIGHSYGSQRLKRLLAGLSAESPAVQQAALERELATHQGATAQRDDITVVGVRPR
jgi:serine phosphatase RsbU (regulator of sigma subunit)